MMAELATLTGLERSTISGLIDRAAPRALVRRIAGAIGKRIGPVTGRLNSIEQKRLTTLLTKVLDS
jgi:hypothetical protein